MCATEKEKITEFHHQQSVPAAETCRRQQKQSMLTSYSSCGGHVVFLDGPLKKNLMVSHLCKCPKITYILVT